MNALPPPRIWPLALACVAVVLSTLGLSGLALALLAHRAGLPELSAAHIRPLLGQPHTTLVLLTCQSLATALTAVVAASLGPIPPAERLDVRRGTLPAARRPFAAIAMVFATLSAGAVAYTALLALKGGHDHGTLKMFDELIAGASGSERGFILLDVALFAPLAEELFFRGYLQSRLVARFGAGVGVVAAAALFGLAHFDPIQSPATFVMGLVLGYGAVRAGSLWLPVVGHVVNNALAFAAAGASEPPNAGDLVSALALYVPLAIVSFLALERTTRPDA